MTTRTWTQSVDCTNNTTFLATMNTLTTNLSTCGLVNTADTGQFDLGAGTTAGGYQIWRLPTSNLYFKFTFSGTSQTMNFTVQVGTGSNGSGTLTGQLSTATNHNTNGAAFSQSTLGNCYACVTNETFTLIWGIATANGGATGLSVHVGRTTDSSQTPTSDGYLFCIGFTTGGAMRTQSVKTAATAFTGSMTNGTQCNVVGTPSDTTDNAGNKQVYPWWLNLPYGQAYAYAVTYRSNEATAFNTITVNPFGGTPRTYLAIGATPTGIYGSVQASSTWLPAFLWE